MSLKTKNVFVTGGAAGLGKVFTSKLLEAGAKVVFCDINEDTGKETQKELAAKYGAVNVTFLQLDVTDKDKMEEVFQSAVNKLGHIDLMVNNAGFMVESKWEAMINLNFTAMVRGTYMARDHMRKDKGGKGGRIINMSSLFGLENGFTVPVYCGTKQAVRGFTMSLAEAPDVPAHGVEYAILCPGPTATDLCLKLDDSKIYHYNLVAPEMTPERMLGTPEEVGDAFMKLATLEEMNGAILYTDKLGTEFYKMKREKISWPETNEP